MVSARIQHALSEMNVGFRPARVWFQAWYERTPSHTVSLIAGAGSVNHSAAGISEVHFGADLPVCRRPFLAADRLGRASRRHQSPRTPVPTWAYDLATTGDEGLRARGLEGSTWDCTDTGPRTGDDDLTREPASPGTAENRFKSYALNQSGSLQEGLIPPSPARPLLKGGSAVGRNQYWYTY